MERIKGTVQDWVLCMFVKFVRTGSRSSVTDDRLKRSLIRTSELAIHRSGTRVVSSLECQDGSVDELYSVHPGIVRIK